MTKCISVNTVHGVKYILVDSDNYENLNMHRWYISQTDGKEYAFSYMRLIDGVLYPLSTWSDTAKRRAKTKGKFNKEKLYKDGSKKRVSLHRYILHAPDDKEVDHIDGNGLNNTMGNLRVCTRLENARNRKLSVSNTSGYHGVYYDLSGSRRKRWAAVIRVDKKKKTIGRFYTKEEAAYAYNCEARKSHGKFASLNPLPYNQ